MDHVSVRIQGCAGRITLTRPEALNALSHEMCLVMESALDDWRNNPEVKLVIVDAEGDRAFCAGGDIAGVYRAALSGDPEMGRRFWRDEYRLNAKVANYPKPYVAFCQGFVMGGGVGISSHGSHRVVGERSIISMPEVGIGLIPDVGGSLLLARAPGQLGQYLGLGGVRMDAGDAIRAGFADTYIPEQNWPELIAHLAENGDPDILNQNENTPPPSSLLPYQTSIDHLFDATSVGEILRRLDQDNSEFAKKIRDTIRRASPISVLATFELINRARENPDIRHALTQEFHFTWRAVQKSDFLEGVRAAVIDKDRNPNWKHRRIEDVSPQEISDLLSPIPTAINFEGSP